MAIDWGAASDLKIDGTVAAATAIAIAITGSLQTLEIGSSGHLTINASESITNGTIPLAGGTPTDISGLTPGSGATLIEWVVIDTGTNIGRRLYRSDVQRQQQRRHRHDYDGSSNEYDWRYCD